jgi:drug/metabolite transporter (DMT)-like permease
MFGTVLGALALHEELSFRGWLGVVMISLGISLVGLDGQGEGG